jgi:hypothetical protein
MSPNNFLSGDNAVKMGMEVELLSPGMQHGSDSEIAPEPVVSKLQQALCGAVEEQRINLMLIS